MTKKEIKELRRPFLRELFRNNGFNLAMTVVSVALAAASNIVISWLIKEVSDLISGTSDYGFGTLLAVVAAAILMFEAVRQRMK